MTKDKHTKRSARAYAAEHGIAYVHARRVLAGGGGGRAGGPPSVPPESGDGDDLGPKSLTQLLADYPAEACDQLSGEPLHPTWMRDEKGIALDVDVLPGMSEPSVHEFDLDDKSIDVDVVEELEGGTLICTVTASGTLKVEAVMAKGDAVVAAEVGQVVIVDVDFNRHYSSVVFSTEVEVYFDAIVDPDYEAVHDFSFTGAAVIGGGHLSRGE